MAGTRLWMQGAFVVQFFVLTVVALYIGLYNTRDPLSFHLPMYHRGRKLIRQSIQTLEEYNDNPIQVPALRLATISTHVGSLQAALSQQQHDDVPIQVIAKENDDVCQKAANNDEIDNPDNVHIWFCPSPPQERQAQIENLLIRNGITFVYSQEVMGQVISSIFLHDNELYPQRKPLKLILMMEYRPDWNTFAQALTLWIEENTPSLQRWPCLRGPIQTELVLSSLKSQTMDKENSSLRLLPAKQVQEAVLQSRQTLDAWNAILYVPKTTPAIFTDARNNKRRTPCIWKVSWFRLFQSPSGGLYPKRSKPERTTLT
jgi:hypothetical protein